MAPAVTPAMKQRMQIVKVALTAIMIGVVACSALAALSGDRAQFARTGAGEVSVWAAIAHAFGPGIFGLTSNQSMEKLLCKHFKNLANLSFDLCSCWACYRCEASACPLLHLAVYTFPLFAEVWKGAEVLHVWILLAESVIWL